MTVLLVSLALAHVTHDEVVAVGAPDDLGAGLPWLLVLLTPPVQGLLRSDDGGASWRHITGPPLVDDLIGAAVLADGMWVLAGSGRLWTSADAGGSWVALPFDGELREIAGSGDALLIAADTGLWTGAPGALTRVVDSTMTALQPGERPAALDASGQLWVEAEGRWNAEGTPVAGATAVAASDTNVFVGTSEGQVFRWDGDAWESCALAPSGLGHPGIVRLAAGTDSLLVSDGDTTWLADGDCAGWLGPLSPLNTSYDTEGGMSRPGQAASVLRVAGDRWLHAGWDGLALAADGGWSTPVVVPPDYTRGLAFGDDGALWVGGYAAGVARTDDGGRSWSTSAGSFGQGNVQRVGTSGPVGFAVSSHRGWRSDDGGGTWAQLDLPFQTVTELIAEADGARVLAFSDRPADAPLRSNDGGDTWSRDAELAAALAGSAPRSVVRVGQGLAEIEVVVAGKPARVVGRRGGGAWQELLALGEGAGVTHAVSWPQERPSRVVFADEEGVHSTADGVMWSLWKGLDDDPPAQLGVAGDKLFLTTRTGAVWRSADGGLSWSALDARIPARVYEILARQGLPADVLFGTHDGIYTLSDVEADSPDVLRALAWQRVDDATSFVGCQGCEMAAGMEGAGLGQVTPLGDGGVMSTQLRGTSVRVIGTRAEGAQGTLLVDGVEVAELGGPALWEPDVLAVTTGLGEGWHRIEVVASVTGLAIDAVEATGDGVLLTAPVSECGCGVGGRRGWLGSLLVAGIFARGRKRGPS